MLVVAFCLIVADMVANKRKTRLYTLHGGPLDGGTHRATPNAEGTYEIWYSEKVRPIKESRSSYWRKKERGGKEATMVRSLAEDHESFEDMAIYVARKIDGYDLEYLPHKK